MQHSIQGILFDKDDTLIDLAAFCRKPIYMTAAYLSQHMGKGTDEGWIERLAEASGFRGDTLLADAPIVSGTNRDLMEAWRTVLRTGGMQLSEELAQNALDYLQWACEHHGNLKARADLPALLQKLKARSIRLGVATSDDYLPTVQCLRALGVAHLFDAVFGADRVPSPRRTLPACSAASTACCRNRLRWWVIPPTICFSPKTAASPACFSARTVGKAPCRRARSFAFKIWNRWPACKGGGPASAFDSPRLFLYATARHFVKNISGNLRQNAL